MSGISIKSSAKILAIAGLVIGISALGFAQSSGSGSVVNQLNNSSASNNTSPSPMNSNGGHSGGDSGGHSGGDSGGHSGGDSGGHSGGSSGHSSGGDDGGGPPPCVPEPVSMLALGIGSGIVMLKKRAKKA